MATVRISKSKAGEGNNSILLVTYSPTSRGLSIKVYPRKVCPCWSPSRDKESIFLLNKATLFFLLPALCHAWLRCWYHLMRCCTWRISFSLQSTPIETRAARPSRPRVWHMTICREKRDWIAHSLPWKRFMSAYRNVCCCNKRPSQA